MSRTPRTIYVWICGRKVKIRLTSNKIKDGNGEPLEGYASVEENEIVIWDQSHNLTATILHELLEFAFILTGICLQPVNGNFHSEMYAMNHGQFDCVTREIGSAFEQILEKWRWEKTGK